MLYNILVVVVSCHGDKTEEKLNSHREVFPTGFPETSPLKQRVLLFSFYFHHPFNPPLVYLHKAKSTWH